MTADFNRDGNADVFLMDAYGSGLVLLGNGDGTLRSEPLSPYPGNHLGVGVSSGIVGDLNSDGITDIVVGTNFFQPPFVLLGNGDGTFNVLPQDSHLTSATDAVFLADFDGDGNQDLVLPYLYGGETNVYTGRGDGTFTPDIYSPGLAYFTSESLASADFNGDGQADIVDVFAGDYNQLAVLLSQPASTAAGYAPNISPVGTGYHYVEASYPGNTQTPSGVSPTIALLAQQVATNLSLTALPSGNSLQGQPVTLTAQLDQYIAQNHSATGSVEFTSNGGLVGTAQVVNGQASLVTMALGAGSDSLQAYYEGDTNFEDAASTPLTFTVNPQQMQTIAFPQPPSPAYAGTAVILQASSSSGLPVTYRVVSGPGRLSSANGAVLIYGGVGTVVIEANQAGNGTTAPAAPIQRSVTTALLTAPVGGGTALISTTVVFTAAGAVDPGFVYTKGLSNGDFGLEVRPGGHCSTTGMVAIGQTCTLSFSFHPTEPGLREGGIVLLDQNNHTVLANSYVFGVGTGPLVNWRPGAKGILGTSSLPALLTVDGAGDTFFVDEVEGSVKEFVAVGGRVPQNSTARTISSGPSGGFNLPSGIAIDGSGNLFVADAGASALYEIAAVHGTIPPNPSVRLLARVPQPFGLLVDRQGDLIFSVDSAQNGPPPYIGELQAIDGTIPNGATVLMLATGFVLPCGIAKDSSGNIFVADSGANAIDEILAVDGVIPTSPTVQKLNAAFTSPNAVDVDLNGNLYVTDNPASGGTVIELLTVNGVLPASPAKSILADGLVEAGGVFVDPSGNVFFTDFGGGAVFELDYADTPALTFADTPVGQTSSDSPQVATLLNIGNVALTFATPSSGNNPAISTGFVSNSGSTCPQLSTGSPQAVLGAGASCTDSVSFLPVSGGPYDGTLITTDSSLNVGGSTQTIKLEGNGLANGATINFTVADHIFGDPPFSVSATSNSTGAITYSVVSGPATISGATVALTGAGSVTLLASQAASGAFGATTHPATFNVAKAPQTISFAVPASPVSFGAIPVSLTATASSGLPVSFSVLSGPGTISGGTLTYTGVGTIIVAADQGGNVNYQAATEVTHSVVVVGRSDFNVLAASPNPVFVQNVLTLTSTLSGASGPLTGSVSFFDGATALGSSIASNDTAALQTSGLAVGTHRITAVYSGDANYASVVSNTVKVVVEDFSLSALNPHVTINHGGTATFNLVVSSVQGVGTASTIIMTVEGAPNRSVVRFTPSIIPTGSGTVDVSMVVKTPNYPTGPFGYLTPTAGTSSLAILSASCLLGIFRRRRCCFAIRLTHTITLALCSLGALGALSGCGSGWRSQGWTMTVRASSGALSRSMVVYLTSQCSNGEPVCPIE